MMRESREKNLPVALLTFSQVISSNRKPFFEADQSQKKEADCKWVEYVVDDPLQRKDILVTGKLYDTAMSG